MQDSVLWNLTEDGFYTANHLGVEVLGLLTMSRGGLYLAVFFRRQVGKLGHVKIVNVLCASLRMNVLITSSLNARICWAGLWAFFGEELQMLCYVWQRRWLGLLLAGMTRIVYKLSSAAVIHHRSWRERNCIVFQYQCIDLRAFNVLIWRRHQNLHKLLEKC